MKKLILSAAFVGVMAWTAHAQTTPAPATDGDMPAVATPDSTNMTAPVEGKNSFTEAQAKERFEAAGISSVTALKLDDMGVWQAMGTKDGKSVTVSMDYQGNIVSK